MTQYRNICRKSSKHLGEQIFSKDMRISRKSPTKLLLCQNAPKRQSSMEKFQQRQMQVVI